MCYIGGTSIAASKSSSSTLRSVPQQSSYQIPASALFENNEEPISSSTSVGRAGDDAWDTAVIIFSMGCIWVFVFLDWCL